MRLKRLDLTRYGKFTDHHVDFGEPVAGAPDLHIVYGPNEAGKSTLFAAWLDLLYGIGMQSPFNFLHPYSSMRIGGALEFSGGAREFARIKRPQNSLLDAHDQAIGENAILGELGGIDREAYRTMFSLDDDSLEEGGESILKARGDLGQLLFSGSSGLADLSRKIADLHSEADGFYKSHARSGQLHDLQKELDRLKQERAQIDTQASKYAELSEAAKRAKARHDETTVRRGQSQARKDEIQRLLNARPRLAKLRSLREQLAPLEGLPDAPAGWAETLPTLREEEIKLETQIAANADEVERSTSAVEAIGVDQVGLSLAGKLDDADSLRARYLTAEKDVPDRRQKLHDLDHAIAFQLRQIEREGEANPGSLILPASTVERLRELIESRSGIETAVSQAEEEWTEARHRLQATEDKLADAADPSSPAGDRGNLLENLKLALAALRQSDHAARRRLADRAYLEGRSALDDCLAALVPWHGDEDQLVAMIVPALETIQRWKTAWDASQKRVDQHHGEMARLQSECVRLSAQRDATTSVTGLVTDQDAVAIRAERDHAWAEHRSRLDATSADRFEDVLRRDDGVVAQRFGHMVELAQLHETSRALKIAQSDFARAEELHAQSLADSETLAREIAKAISELSPLLPSDWTLPQIEGWLARRDKALEARASVRTAERDLQQAQDDATVLGQRLTATLRTLNIPVAADADETSLIAAAQASVDSEAEYRRHQQTLEERQRDAAARKRAFERAETGKQQWDAAWKEIGGACWLGESGAMPSIAAVRGILAVTSELASTLKERTMLADRIAKMEKDQREFQDFVISLADAAGIAQADASAVMDLLRQIEERARKADADRTRKTEEMERLEAARAISRELAEQKVVHDRRKQEMTSYFGVVTLAEVATKLGQIVLRNSAQRELAEVAQEILTALRSTSLAEAEAMLDSADQAALGTELAEITAQAETLEQEWRDSYATYKDAEKQIDAIGGDASVAEIEEKRRTILVEIEERARRYMRLRAGAMVTERALRLYREQHRSSMMAHASEALRVISRGAYTQLTTQPDKDSEVLVAIAADKGSKLVTEMSKGTRFQLYLALRVAGYFEFAKTRSPVPFIADDIMETFDDFRAEEAFRLFSQMAEAGQVIYLTHHRHLCEIAREVCPTVKVHDLSGLVTPERETA
ncbi:MAG: AAA family ATPase [Parvibaculaceae bacterium]|nr:AAA family ATPase [Parvibaculaceae bacterium]